MKSAFSLWFLAETKTYPHQWFFTAASIYAILMVPLAILARHGYGPIMLAAPTTHAFEMLFGFVGAIVAGFLLTAVWFCFGVNRWLFVGADAKKKSRGIYVFLDTGSNQWSDFGYDCIFADIQYRICFSVSAASTAETMGCKKMA